MRKITIYTVLVVALSFISVPLISNTAEGVEGNKKKVLYVDSYHTGYPWSEGITQGILETLNVTLSENDVTDSAESDVILKIIRMDTKRNTSEEFKSQAALDAKKVIEEWQPDIVIASDDNASKYLIAPYFKDNDLPFVFCGVNWDASHYGFPAQNVTGMIEVSLIPNLIDSLKTYAKGDQIGLLGADNISNRKEAEYYKSTHNLQLEKEVFVNTFEEWKQEYVTMQNEVDMIIMAPPSFLQEEKDKTEAKAFVQENTLIPTGCVEDWIMPYALIGYTKNSQEQGEWAAQTAIKILDGTAPSEIPLTTNKQGNLSLNLLLADKLDIVFTPFMLKNAEIIE